MRLRMAGSWFTPDSRATLVVFWPPLIAGGTRTTAAQASAASRESATYNRTLGCGSNAEGRIPPDDLTSGPSALDLARLS